MKCSVGIDIVSIARIEDMANRHGERFYNRIYTLQEIEYCTSKKGKFLHLAARFAAKEAFVKAVGTGFRFGIAWKDIEVSHNNFGKPFLQLHGKALEQANNQNFNHFEISLTHDRTFAAAIVIAL